ncbi:MAG: hypothetical protein GXO11_03605 [Epsilonproteobacteria bacterium]|nr:hypothetical protein [Campylobacterota bacterium]
MKYKKIYLFLAVLIVLTPFGLLTQNPAWGEWEEEYYHKVLGFIPQGIQNASLVDAPLGEYSVGGFGEVSSYYLSAILGVVVIFGVFVLLKKVIHADK